MDIIPVSAVPRLPRRAADGHKGTYSTVLVIAGSQGMTGAAILTGRAALRAGAGLVRVACPVSVLDIIAAGCPCYTTVGIRQHTDGSFGDGAIQELLDFARNADVVAIGPGLGRGNGMTDFVRSLLDGLTETPIVLDADGLNALAPFPEDLRPRAMPLVLTPHPGEFGRLTAVVPPKTPHDREYEATTFAAKFRVVLLLKGMNTLVSDGRRLYRNSTGNPGMATGGAGDVLTGIISSLIGLGLTPFDAAALGAWVHGRAGDLAAMELGQTALTATDVIEHLPAAFRQLEMESW
jgi:NAD(P)H-hydrate epimerase